jgi:zinc transport system substrate-binding protein
MKILRYSLVIASLLLAACEGKQSVDGDNDSRDESRPLVVASNYPLYFFATEIAGDYIEIELPEIEGDPATWKPGPEAVALMQSADRVILNGAGYEGWLDWVTLAEDRMLDTSAGFRDRLIPLGGETLHQHGPEGEHSHAGMAFTTWLDPTLAAAQARAVEESLSTLSPENAGVFSENLAALTSRLESLDEALSDAFSGFQDQPLVFSHPVYQYLESRYGLDGVSLHWEPGEDPGVTGWIDLQNVLRRHPAKRMIWEDQPLAATSERLLEYGILTVPFATASNRPEAGDYFDVMRENITRLLLK